MNQPARPAISLGMSANDFAAYMDEKSSTPPEWFRARVLLRQGTSRIGAIKTVCREFEINAPTAKAIVDEEIKRAVELYEK